RTIPAGQTLTYGEIATRLGDRLLARDVGQALGQNPFPIVVRCHRVLAASGKSGGIKTGGFSAPGGVDTKMRMLSIERAQPGGPTLFDDLAVATRKRRRASTDRAPSCKHPSHALGQTRAFRLARLSPRQPQGS